MKVIHPPGHPQAIKDGCKCPGIDNGHGAGAYADTQGNPVYWFDFACPLHGQAEQVQSETILFEK